MAEDLDDDFEEPGEDEDAPEDLDDEALGDDDLVDDDPLLGVEDAEVIEVIDEVDPAIVEIPVAKPRPKGEDDDDDDDDDEEADDDDVEASLDVILKERLVVADEEPADEEDEVPDQDDRGEGSGRVLPKQPDEFVCQSCFLVKHPSQLADRKKKFCRDCV